MTMAESRVRLYHGTRLTDANCVREDGLRPMEPEAVLTGVLSEMGFASIDEVRPKWLRRHLVNEVKYRQGQGAVVHLTLSKTNAAQYATWITEGGEHAALVGMALWETARRRSKKTFPQRGDRYVVAVDVPWSELDDRHRASLLRIWERGYGDSIEGSGWDVRFAAVPPEWIVSVKPSEPI